MGFPTPEEYKGHVKKSNIKDERLKAHEVFSVVLKNKLLWYVCMANLCLYVVRMGVLNWAPMFLTEFKGMTLTRAGWQVGAYEIAGLMGGLIAGWLSDRVFGGRRGPVGAIFMLALGVSLFFFWKVPVGYAWLDAGILFCVGFLVYGPQVLVGIASADFASRRAVGTANGFAGSFAQIGTILSGYPVGLIADRYGWGGGFVFFIFAAVFGMFFFALTWSHRAQVLD
jgi:sugar phosphate permease